MKKLEDFQAEKAEIKSIYGGLMSIEADAATKKVEYCTCSSGHSHTDHTSTDV